MKKPQIYLTNKDFMREIQNSKNTYCAFISNDVSYRNPDIFIASKDDLTEEIIQKALASKSRNNGGKEFTLNDLVIRIMTNEHVPLDPSNTKKSRNGEPNRKKVNFPPFKNYIIRDGEWIEVGRSHWKGDFETGHFETEHGRIGDTLARMFMLLVERYARKGNWRGYSYNDEMQASALMHLVQVGLQFDESRSANPFSYFTSTISRIFVRVLSLERRQRDTKDDLLFAAGLDPSYTRQIENELENNNLFTPTTKKRGRPPFKKVVKPTTQE